MDFIQPIFVNQTSDIVQGKLGPDNASFPLQKINDVIQKEMEDGVLAFQHPHITQFLFGRMFIDIVLLAKQTNTNSRPCQSDRPLMYFTNIEL